MRMTSFGAIALAVQLTAGALALRARQMPLSLGAVWRTSRDSCAAHLTVIATAIAVIAAANIGDIVGHALAAIFPIWSSAAHGGALRSRLAHAEG